MLFVVPTAQAEKKKKKAQYSIKAKITLEVGADLVVDVEGDLAPCVEWECYLFITAPKKPANKEATLVVSVEDDGSYQLRTMMAPAEGDEAKKKAMKKKAMKKKAMKKKAKKKDDEASEAYTTEGGVALQVKKAPENICDPIELAEYTEYSKKAAKEGKAPADDSWKQLPVLTYGERLACKRRGQTIKTYELDEFTDGDPLAKAESDGDDDDSADAVADSDAEGEDDKSDEPKFDKSSAQLESVDGVRRLTIAAASLPEGDFDLSVNGYWGASVDGTKIGSAARTGVIRVRR
jgi:hypothetical protein